MELEAVCYPIVENEGMPIVYQLNLLNKEYQGTGTQFSLFVHVSTFSVQIMVIFNLISFKR